MQQQQQQQQQLGLEKHQQSEAERQRVEREELQRLHQAAHGRQLLKQRTLHEAQEAKEAEQERVSGSLRVVKFRCRVCLWTPGRWM